MWILTWTCDRTRGSRLNNFYKKGKGKKRKTFCVLIIHKRQTLMRQSTVMQHIHRWSFIWRLPWRWKPLNRIQSLRFTQHPITVFDIKPSFILSQQVGVLVTFWSRVWSYAVWRLRTSLRFLQKVFKPFF